MSESVKILAIESSCDETAAAVVENGRRVLSDVISTQVPVHRLYGGVVPEIASRRHLEMIRPVCEEALREAGLTLADIEAIAVTHGPGLVGALLVGVSYAKALAFAANKPLIAVHHWQAHMAAAQIEHDPPYPYLSLIVSGSHSGIALMDEQGCHIIGESHDDAAGEAFDKIARALGLPYPGGPEIEKAGKSGRADYVEFPRAELENPYDFSFSGLKSAVLNYLNQRQMKGDPLRDEEVPHIAASAEEAICDVLSAKTVAAAKAYGIRHIVLCGGVAANSRLRAMLQKRAAKIGAEVLWPSLRYCTDNAVMVGAAAYRQYVDKDFAPLSLNAMPRLPLPHKAK